MKKTKAATKDAPKAKAKAAAKDAPKAKAKAATKEAPKAKAKAVAKDEPKAKAKAVAKDEPKAKKAKAVAKDEPKAKAKAVAKAEPKATKAKAVAKAEPKAKKAKAATKDEPKAKKAKAAPAAPPPAAPRPKRSSKREKLTPDRLTIIVEAAMASLEDDKAENIVLLDVTGRADYADRLIIATGQVERQLQAMATHLDEALNKVGLNLNRDAIQASPDWVLIDAGDLVIHLFRPEARDLYRIERMWGPESPEASNATPG